MFGIRKRQIEHILAVLDVKTLSALQINEEIKKRYGNFQGIWPGSLIVLLLKLEEEGKVVSGWVDGTYPRRRLYSRAESE